MEETIEIDLFDDYNSLPKEVQNVLIEYVDKFDQTYENCEILVNKLELLGYTCEYYLDAIPFNLRKI